MSRTSQSGLAAQKTPAPVPSGAKGPFDTFETKFFEQGDNGGSQVPDGEQFEDLGEPRRALRVSPSRQFLLGVAVGSISVAVLGCLGLWLTGRLHGQPAKVAAPPVAVVAETPPVPVPAPPPPSAVAPAPPPAAEPAVAVKAEPAPAPAAVAEKPEPPPAPTPAPVRPLLGTPSALGLADKPAPGAAALARCTKAIDKKRSKEILSACPAALAANPAAADIAVALAKTEFDRGRSGHALEWGKKAIAIDPNAADAYVFVGAGEQMAGHGKAAREAYRRYLELAPKGRYAADVRATVGSSK
jgi:hypothetical protein